MPLFRFNTSVEPFGRTTKPNARLKEMDVKKKPKSNPSLRKEGNRQGTTHRCVWKGAAHRGFRYVKTRHLGACNYVRREKRSTASRSREMPRPGVAGMLSIPSSSSVK